MRLWTVTIFVQADIIISWCRWYWWFICTENSRDYRWCSFFIQKPRFLKLGLSIFSLTSIIIFLFCVHNFSFEGGYDLLGRTKDQIRTTEQVNAAMITCQTLKLDGLVIIGGMSNKALTAPWFCHQYNESGFSFVIVGVTSNTDAAQLAETFATSNCSTKVTDMSIVMHTPNLDFHLMCECLWVDWFYNLLGYLSIFYEKMFLHTNWCIYLVVIHSLSMAKTQALGQVVGVPVTLNGDLKNQFVEANVGFDTICKVWNMLNLSSKYGSFSYSELW